MIFVTRPARPDILGTDPPLAEAPLGCGSGGTFEGKVNLAVASDMSERSHQDPACARSGASRANVSPEGLAPRMWLP